MALGQDVAGHEDRSHADVLESIEIVTAPGSSSTAAEGAKEILFGSMAGSMGKLIEYPFDTVKVRLQSQTTAQYSGPIDCMRQTWSSEGWKGFYRGISAPIVGAAAETSSLFFSAAYHAVLQPGSEALSLPALVGCGAVSGAFTSLILTPIELVKCRVQVPQTLATGPPRVVPTIVSIYRHGGLAGFWHGQMGTFVRETGGSAAWFGAYEATSLAFRENNASPLPLHGQLLSGATAGVAYNFIFYPADTVKSRMQTEAVAADGSLRSFGGVARDLWANHGIRGYYRGCGITVLRAAPSSAVIFAVYEALKKHFG